MSVEVEIKLKIEDPEQLIEKLEGLGFIKGNSCWSLIHILHLRTMIFVKLGEALRVRQIRNVDTDEISAVITYRERSWMIVPWQGKNWNWRSQMRKLEKHFFNGLDSIRCRCWKRALVFQEK